MKLLVRNLARTTTEAELTSFFAVFGAVQSCNLVLDKATGKSKGFAFVEMPKVGEAQAAMIKLNNKEVAGNKIRVKKAESQAGNQVENNPEETAPATQDSSPDVEAQLKQEVTQKSEDKVNDKPTPESKAAFVWNIPKK